jgi:hypothetical protein
VQPCCFGEKHEQAKVRSEREDAHGDGPEELGQGAVRHAGHFMFEKKKPPGSGRGFHDV